MSLTAVGVRLAVGLVPTRQGLTPGALMLLLLSAVVAGGPGRRSAALVLDEATATGAAPLRSWRQRMRRLGAARRTRAVESQVRLLITQVTALLRAGAPPAAAWTRAAGVPVDALGVPSQAALSEVIGARSAVAVVGATRLAMTVGAPLAPSLNAVCEALSAQAEAEAERAAALAGPRTTARVLLGLPLLGLGLGWVLGADPLATATDGGIGTACVGLGMGAMVAGRLWINRLVARARRVGEEPV